MVKRGQKKDKVDLKEKMEAFERRCRKGGLKVTPQRSVVYKVLARSKEHPSTEMVYRRARRILPNISLDTVHRTLLTLSEIGAAFVVEGTGDAKRFDGNMENHQHFKCVKCKRIVDFCHKGFENISVPAVIGKKHRVLRKKVYFEGICDFCRKKN
jgi:Fur family peroxide stress response transcriptional regulator